MKTIHLPIDNKSITDSNKLYELLSGIDSSKISEVISPDQLELLQTLVFQYQDIWMDNQYCYFEPLLEFLKTLDFEISTDFDYDFQPWYDHYESIEESTTPKISPIFSAPKLNSQGEVYNCLLSHLHANEYLEKSIQFAKLHNLPVPNSIDEQFTVKSGLKIDNELIYSGMGLEKVVFNSISYLQRTISMNQDKQFVLCLRAFANFVKNEVYKEMSKEIYFTNCFKGKLSDLLDRDEDVWDSFIEHSNIYLNS
ncbi:TPA: hypothetical protein ACGIK9_003294 [Acinetobacter baumannii]|uniref:hypothetical protein n=1 Tax=Acinetobacter baumannii TaxID=470 RepID=UPI00338F2A73